jgi:hypothetical protein
MPGMISGRESRQLTLTGGCATCFEARPSTKFTGSLCLRQEAKAAPPRRSRLGRVSAPSFHGSAATPATCGCAARRQACGPSGPPRMRPGGRRPRRHVRPPSASTLPGVLGRWLRPGSETPNVPVIDMHLWCACARVALCTDRTLIGRPSARGHNPRQGGRRNPRDLLGATMQASAVGASSSGGLPAGCRLDSAGCGWARLPVMCLQLAATESSYTFHREAQTQVGDTRREASCEAMGG